MAFPKLILTFAMAAALVSGCASVNRIDSETVTDLSGAWNDTDLRLTAEEMITDLLTSGLADRYQAENDKRPTLIVGTVANRTDEHIDLMAVTKDMENQLIRSGKFRVVSSRSERDELRDERNEQQDNASYDSMKEKRKELAADYMLKGSVISVVDQKGGKSARFYQVNLELHDLETTEKVWIGEKEIKKMIRKGVFGG